MRRAQIRHIFLTLLFLGMGLGVHAQNDNPPTTRILFIFDGSGSMHGRWESDKKITVAQRLMTQMLDSLNSLNIENFQLALRVYGHTKPSPPQDCNDTHLEVPFADNNFNRIKRTLRSIMPKGTTPIARSLERAASDFPPCDNCRDIIILITDGIEECDGDPCAVSRMLQSRGIILKPFVIGIGLDMEFRETFECVGNYYDAADENTFREVLGVVISQALNNTTAQINLIDDNGSASETDVPVTLYNHVSGKLEESFVHTMNFRGYPDTIYLDPLVIYDMVVHTIPPVRTDSIRIVAGRHNQVGARAGQGSLELRMGSPRNNDMPVTIVRKHNSMATINTQLFNTEQEYLTGLYDLEILTLPRIYQNGVRIDQSTSTRVAIPTPGTVTFQTIAPGPGAIFVMRGDKLEWVVDLDPTSSRQSFALQPGNYKVIFRVQSAQNTSYSKTESFTVSTGNSTIVKIQ